MSTRSSASKYLAPARQSGWGIFALLPFLGALLFAWYTLAAVNFLYPLWYQVLDLGQTIERYAPQNHYRRNFQDTDRQERIRLFAGIVHAIDHGGEGLAQLTYHDTDGKPIDRLLRQAEIVHLQDVALLVHRLSVAAWLALGLWVLAVVWVLARRHRMPAISRLGLMAVLLLGVAAVLILLIGPERVFYHLHAWIFPAGHAWFFYYQDSLLTTMMRAPDLFGPITVSLIGVALLYWLGLLAGARALQATTLSKRARGP